MVLDVALKNLSIVDEIRIKKGNKRGNWIHPIPS